MISKHNPSYHPPYIPSDLLLYTDKWSFLPDKGSYECVWVMGATYLYIYKASKINMRLICLDFSNKGIQIGCNLVILFALSAWPAHLLGRAMM